MGSFQLQSALLVLTLCFNNTASCCHVVTILPSKSTHDCDPVQNCQTLNQFSLNTTNSLCVNLIFLPEDPYTLDSDLVINSSLTTLMVHSSSSQDTASIECSNSAVSVLFKNLQHASIRNLLFSSCKGIEIESVENVTLENCKFLYKNSSVTPAIANHTILTLKNSKATIKNSSFFLDKPFLSSHCCNHGAGQGTEKFMIVVHASGISIQSTTFRALWCGVLHSQDSTVKISNSKIYNSTTVLLPHIHEHLVLVRLINSTLNLDNSTISNNTMRIMLLAKNCNVSIGSTNITGNVGTFSVVALTKTDANITGGNIFSNNTGAFLVMNGFIKFSGDNLFMNCKQVYNRSTEQRLQPEGMITSLQSSIQIENGTTSLLENNSERSGGALYLSESRISISGNLVVANNTANDSGGGAFLYLTKFICSGNCTFVSNRAKWRGGGIRAISSQIILRRESIWKNLQYKCTILNISHNVAREGGGVCLEMNSLIRGLDDHDYFYNMQFLNNSAFENGGAIFVDDGSYSGTCKSTSSAHYLTETECFLQTFTIDYVQKRPAYHKQHVTFVDNSAQAGQILYGGLLDRCSVNLVSNGYSNTFHGPPVDGLTYFMRESDLNSTQAKSQIASGAVQICFCDESSVYNCSYEPFLHAKKGHNFTVTIVALDQVENTVNGTVVRASLTNNNVLGEGQDSYYISTGCTNITLSISSPDNSAELGLYVRKGLCKDLGLSKRTIVVYFDNCTCPIGFSPATSTNKCECKCDPRLQPYVTVYDSVSFKRNGYYWIGYDHVSRGYIIHQNCPYDYCLPANSTAVNLNDSNGADSQCNFNRTGLLCAMCKPGFSLSPASSRCLYCPQNWHGLLVLKLLIDSIFGVLVIALILALDLTVAVGTLNGLIFYANIIQAHSQIFLPFERQNFCTVFIRLLNTQLSIDQCFFTGMDAYARIWIKLLFPAYLIVLVILIIIGSRCSSKCANLLSKRNPVAALATLTLLSHTSIFCSIIDIFTVAVVEYPDGSNRIVWRPDANITYLKGKHIPLFLLATILVIVGLSYSIALFMWQWLLRASNLRLLCLVQSTKLNLFVDTYHAPYQPKHRYWTGLLLFVRIVINFPLEIDSSKDKLYSILNMGVLLSLLLLLKASVCNQVYKRKFLDFLESVNYINLLIFSVANVCFLGNPPRQRVAAYASVGVAFVLFVSILFYHTHCMMTRWLWYKMISIEMKHRVCVINIKFWKKRIPDDSEERHKATYHLATPTSTEIKMIGTYSEDEESSGIALRESKRQHRLGIKSYTSAVLRESLLQ